MDEQTKQALEACMEIKRILGLPLTLPNSELPNYVFQLQRAMLTWFWEVHPEQRPQKDPSRMIEIIWDSNT